MLVEPLSARKAQMCTVWAPSVRLLPRTPARKSASTESLNLSTSSSDFF